MKTLPEFDELKTIRTTIAAMVEAETETTEQRPRLDRRRFEDTIFELITMGYVYGIEVAGLDLETDLPVSADRMRQVADAPTKGETFRDRMATHFREYENTGDAETLINQLSVIAETETHRAINTGGQDGADEFVSTHPNSNVYKTWFTAGDERVRDTHDYLEGASVPYDARFYTYDGDSARFPGDFVLPNNNINCRCILRYSQE